VHNKDRNKLDSKRAQDLVYFYINARLFSISLKENIKKENVNIDERTWVFVPLGHLGVKKIWVGQKG